mgnify:CR=1 FL=1
MSSYEGVDVYVCIDSMCISAGNVYYGESVSNKKGKQLSLIHI